MRGNRRDRQRDDFRAEESDGLVEHVIAINRVMRVRAGGRRIRYNALTVVGDRNGHVGVGFGKANEPPEAIRKALQDARRNLIEVPLVNGTIPHEVIGRSDATRVLLKPASPGTGIVAGSAPRIILELAGVQDVLSKIYGSRNKINAAAATIKGLMQLRSAATVARLRGKTVREILGIED
ncbi:MAG: 30S ribosomal protein S5 [Candidatus Poribacteria bacterium]|nr:MAG: 30S ribosomal protein S5 [Candidatus Poribacteria bacterium]